MANSLPDIEIDRSRYDHYNEERHTFRLDKGISEEVVRAISKDKGEPEWMLQKRLEGLALFHSLAMPNWGPDLSGLDFNELFYYLKPDAKKNATSWEDVPEDIKNTFDKLGIPEAEKKALAGVGGQYDSEVIYHSLKKNWEDKGVVFLDCDEALKQYPDLMKKYFMTTCVPANLHKFAALHAAVWSGGTFIYIPKGVKLDMPLQAYFRMNAKQGGQFEHTLIIVDEGAEMSYVEGCFTKGTIITTQNGYKKIEDVSEKDKVLTSEGNYMKVRDLQEYPYSGDLYKIDVYGDTTKSLYSTPEHPFLYVDKIKNNEKNNSFTPRWNTPRFFSKGDYLAIPINAEESSAEKRTLIIQRFEKNKQVTKRISVRMSKEFFRLIGYYLAEGSVSSNSYLNFSFSSKEREYIEDVKICLKKVFNYTKSIEIHHKVNNGTSVVVSSVDLARLFKIFGTKCDNKVLPSWVLSEKKDFQKELIKCWFRGDGNYYKKRSLLSQFLKESFRINTTSEFLALQGRDLLLRLGVVSFINKQNRDKTGRKTMFTLGITGEYLVAFGSIVGIPVKKTLYGKKRASMFGLDSKFAYFPIKKITKKRVIDVPVRNFGVEKHETYTANGFAVHNCSAPQYTTNSLHAGCVEIHVLKGARARYNSIENWSKNTFNLNTKRAIAHDDAIIEWINGNMGSNVTMLYPTSVLLGKRSKSDFIGIAFAGQGQHQDTGCKVHHIGENSSSTIVSKSISKEGGITSYRGLVSIQKSAKNASTSVKCDALMFDNKSQSNTYPFMDVKAENVSVAHEATVGKISEEQIFYLMSRGLDEDTATNMIVSGFVEPIVKELPLEYAVELNRLIQLEMEGSLG